MASSRLRSVQQRRINLLYIYIRCPRLFCMCWIVACSTRGQCLGDVLYQDPSTISLNLDCMDWSAPRPAVPQSQSAPCDVNYLCVPQKAVSNSQAGTGTGAQGHRGTGANTVTCHATCPCYLQNYLI